jgi:hypothetical protein
MPGQLPSGSSYQQSRSLIVPACALILLGRSEAFLFCTRPSMADYHSIIARAVSCLPSTADEARHAIYEQARTALHERLGSDPQITDTELVNEHYKLEVAIYEVEEDLLLSDMRRFVKEETDFSSRSLSFISKIKEFVRSAEDSLGACRGALDRLGWTKRNLLWSRIWRGH